MAWTEERIEALRSLAAEGHAACRIAEELGCSRSAVTNAAYRYQVQIRSIETIWTDEKKEELRTLTQAGKTAAQIGAILGITRSAVISATHRLGTRLEHFAISWDEVKLAELRELVSQGKTTRQCAHILGLSRTGVSAAARRHGIAFALPKGRKDTIPKRRKLKQTRTVYSFSVAGAMAKPEYELPELRTVPVAPLNITFDQLEWDSCRYPTTDVSPHLFCGHPKLTTSSYCLEHHFLCLGRRRETAEENAIRKRMFRREQVSKILEAAE